MSFWNVPYRGNLSWSWKKMLQIRPIIRQFIWVNIGNGALTNAWYDNWCSSSPLCDKLSPREIASAGFSIDTKVGHLFRDGQWNVPQQWLHRVDLFTSSPTMFNATDSWYWKGRDGVARPFSVNVVWEDLRPRHASAIWSDLAWFNYCIPRHAFIIWLVFRRRLKTQDQIMQWDLAQDMDLKCTFCRTEPDSHNHLIFECNYAMQVWNKVNMKVVLCSRSSNWDQIIDRLLPVAKKKTMENVIDKLILAASVYFIWQERNTRLFMKIARPPDVLAEIIFSTVHLKMLTFKYKRKAHLERLIAAWDLPISLPISY